VRPKFLVGRHPYAAAGAWGCASYLKYGTDPTSGSLLFWSGKYDILVTTWLSTIVHKHTLPIRRLL
jgi:hypothetical protein